MAKSLIRSSAALAMADFSKKALLALTVLICARLVPKETFGNYMFLMSFYQVFSVVAGAGIPNILVRQVASDCCWVPDRVLGGILARAVCTVPAAALMVGFFIVGGFSRAFLPALGILSLLILLRAVTENAIATFQGREEMMVCAATSFVQSTVTLVATVVVCITSKQLLPLVACHLLGTTCSTVFALFMFRRTGLAMLSSIGHSVRVARNLLRETGWMNGAALISSAYNRCDVLLLERLASSTAVAVYSAPYRVLDIAQIVPQGVMGVVLARLSAGTRQDGGKLDQGLILSVLFLAAALLIVVSTLAAPLLVPLLLGKTYASSVLVVQVLVWATPLMFWNGAVNVNLIAHSAERYIFYGCAAALAFNVFANLALIPHFGYLACAFITVGTECVLAALNLYYCRRTRLSFHFIHPSSILGLMIVALAGSFLWTLRPMGLALPGLLILCLVGMLAVFEFQRIVRRSPRELNTVVGKL